MPSSSFRAEYFGQKVKWLPNGSRGILPSYLGKTTKLGESSSIHSFFLETHLACDPYPSLSHNRAQRRIVLAIHISNYATANENDRKCSLEKQHLIKLGFICRNVAHWEIERARDGLILQPRETFFKNKESILKMVGNIRVKDKVEMVSIK